MQLPVIPQKQPDRWTQFSFYFYICVVYFRWKKQPTQQYVDVFLLTS